MTTFCLLAALVGPMQAQLSISNRIEYQLGNIPDTEPDNRTTLYDQLNVHYFSDNYELGFRAETFSVRNRAQDYRRLSQKYVRYRSGGLNLTIGNLYKTFGKGLLLRTYDLTGVTYEDRASRQRYGFYRDIEGVSFNYSHDYVEANLLYGRPLRLFQPPAQPNEVRRSTLIQGGEVSFPIWMAFKPGVQYLRSESSNNMNEYGGGSLQGYLKSETQYYVEFVQNFSSQPEAFQLGSRGKHAFYASLNQTIGELNFSLEYKDYHKFTLIFNEPPSLVKEHSPTLLNRSTHAVQPFDERGFQLEGVYNLGDFNTATVNWSRAEGEFGQGLKVFNEYYVDINYYLQASSLFKVFVDWSEDEVINVNDRITSGFSLDHQVSDRWSVLIDVQGQRLRREYTFSPELEHHANNMLLGLSFSRAPSLSFGANLEISDDPLETDRLLEEDKYEYKYWPNVFVSYRYNQNHDVYLFAGQRRGGNACSGGICYEVQPFTGIELRVNSVL